MSDALVPSSDEHLTDGWEPDLAATDTLVRRAVLVHASWAREVAQALGRPSRRTDRWAGGFIGERGALTNPVVLLQPQTDPAAWPGILAEIDDVIPPAAPYFLISPFPTPDLGPLGLTRIGHPPLMVRLPGGTAPPLSTGVTLEEVRDAKRLAIAERVLVEGYPMPELQPLTPGDLLGPPILDGPTRVWLAEVDGEPGAVAAAHTHGDAVLVEYVAALETARGRGAAAAATWAATLAEPGLPAVLIASDDGRPLYERMGYLAVERWTVWVRLAT